MTVPMTTGNYHPRIKQSTTKLTQSEVRLGPSLTSDCVKVVSKQLKGSVKEPNKFHIYETEKITRKAK